MECKPNRAFPRPRILVSLQKEQESILDAAFQVLASKNPQREGNRVASVTVFVAQAEGSTWFCEHSFPTKTRAVIELLNVTKQVPESLTMAFIQPFSSFYVGQHLCSTQQRVINTTSTISQCKNPHIEPRAPFRPFLRSAWYG